MQRLLVSLNNDLVSLHKVSLEELMLWKGIGPAKAVKIKAALELVKEFKAHLLQNKLDSQAVKWHMMSFFLP